MSLSQTQQLQTARLGSLLMKTKGSEGLLLVFFFVCFVSLKHVIGVFIAVIYEGSAALLRNENVLSAVLEARTHIHKSSFVSILQENEQGINEQHRGAPDSAASSQPPQ